jgi:hypothetical protein
VRKKISFVTHLIQGLKLAHTVACHARLEELSRRAPRAVFDVVISRALGSFSAWLDPAVSLLDKAGFILALKGPLVHGELAALPRDDEDPGLIRAGGRLLAMTVTEYRLPVSGDRRCLVRLAPVGRRDAACLPSDTPGEMAKKPRPNRLKAARSSAKPSTAGLDRHSSPFRSTAVDRPAGT